MFQFIQDLLLVNHGLVLIYGGKSPVIPYLWSTKAIRGLEIAWDMRFNHKFYRYLKHDEPSHIWRTNAQHPEYDETNPGVGKVRISP